MRMSLEQRCNFKTERLLVRSWKHQIQDPSNEHEFAKIVSGILTDNVTKSLPVGWQGLDSLKKSIEWIRKRAEESSFLTVQLINSNDVVGFMFLYESILSDRSFDLRLGYLLSESVWRQGFGSELIKGLVDWCMKNDDIKSISGGVEIGNVGSIRVLERNGFSIVNSNDQSEDVVFFERKLPY